jgi:glycerate kinase
VRVLAAVDKFRGTASAAEAAKAISNACWELGHDCDEAPLADGGEGTLDVLGGPNRTLVVDGPLGRPVEAGWRLQGRTAIIEMARASGLVLAGGAEGNDPMNASTRGTGQLIVAAINAGARKIIVCLGGSATTDGGLGALQAMPSKARLRGIDLLVACDVTTRFTDAARVFGPQKGASPAQIDLLTGRLNALGEKYVAEYGVEVREIPGAGAAGGLAGALAAVGGRLVPGFDLIADEIDLHDRVDAADLVITGEGYLDEQSFEGKVVGGVVGLAAMARRDVRIIVGDGDEAMATRLGAVRLVERFGREASMQRTTWCIEQAARQLLSSK